MKTDQELSIILSTERIAATHVGGYGLILEVVDQSVHIVQLQVPALRVE
jgi:hypothetical protein